MPAWEGGFSPSGQDLHTFYLTLGRLGSRGFLGVGFASKGCLRILGFVQGLFSGCFVQGPLLATPILRGRCRSACSAPPARCSGGPCRSSGISGLRWPAARQHCPRGLVPQASSTRPKHDTTCLVSTLRCSAFSSAASFAPCMLSPRSRIRTRV